MIDANQTPIDFAKWQTWAVDAKQCGQLLGGTEEEDDEDQKNGPPPPDGGGPTKTPPPIG